VRNCVNRSVAYWTSEFSIVHSFQEECTTNDLARQKVLDINFVGLLIKMFRNLPKIALM